MCRMGNREALLAGAKDCLVRLGYARTTARDIAEAAGTSLAAIAYHFDGKDNLMAAAMVEALEDGVGTTVDDALAATPEDAERAEQFRTAFAQIMAGIPVNRDAALAGVENFAQIDRVPAVHESLVRRLRELNSRIAAEFAERNDGVGDENARNVALFYQVLLHGLTVCWLIDPDQTPSPEQMLDAMRTLTAAE